MKKLFSFMGSALVLAASVSAHAACDIYQSNSAADEIKIMVDGKTYPSMRNLLSALQADPSTLSLVRARKDVLPIVQERVWVPAEGCSPYTGQACFQPMTQTYVPPARRTVVTDAAGNKVTHYTIDDFDNQYIRQYHVSEGIDADVRLIATSDHYADLEKIMNAMPVCQDGALTSSSDDPQLPPPSSDDDGQGDAAPAPAPVASQTPTATSGGYQPVGRIRRAGSATGSP